MADATTPSQLSVLASLERGRLYDLGRVLGANLTASSATKASLVSDLGRASHGDRLPEVLHELGRDPACTDPRIIELCAPHEQVARALSRAYQKFPAIGSRDPNVVGCSDIPVPPFCITTDEDKAALQGFEDDVIDRLFVLNELRAKEGAAEAAKTSGKAATKSAARSPRGKKKTEPD